MHWYNDNELFACDVLEANIASGRLPAGTVDRRSIADVRADDIVGFTQCHFFSGIGGMPYGLRLAGWPDDLAIWTGGFPCQDISVAGRGEGLAGARSGLWWTWFKLIDACRPARLLIENVPALRTRGADDVLAALEGIGYACRAQVVGAEYVGAPHKRHRVWIVADRPREHGEQRAERNRVGICGEPVANANGGTDGAGRTHGGLSVIDQRRASDRPSRLQPQREVDGNRLEPAGGNCQLADGNEPRTGKQPEPGRRAIALHDGGEGMADAGIQGLEGRRSITISTREEVAMPACGGVHRWPSRPGEPQHEWEAPRLIERAVGASVDGLPRRLARWNKAGLKAVGNAVVPQVVAAVASAWLEAMEVA